MMKCSRAAKVDPVQAALVDIVEPRRTGVEEVLDRKVAQLPVELCPSGQEDAKWFERPGRVADPDGFGLCLPTVDQRVVATGRAREELGCIGAVMVHRLDVTDSSSIIDGRLQLVEPKTCRVVGQ